MKLQLLTAVAMTALMAVPSLATADEQGWYVRGNVGYGDLGSMDIAGDLSGDVEGEGNAAGSIGLGYAFGNNWRLELDGAQLWNDLGALSQWANTDAKMRVETGMVNAIYDFDDFGAWRPYVGAGIGIARASLNAQAHSFPNPPIRPVNNPGCLGFNTCSIDDADTATAWQLMAGLGYDITDNLVWDTQYRYLSVGDLHYTGYGADLQAPTLTTLGGNTGIASSVTGTGAHMLMTGLRYKFGAKAAPAPMPAPAPAPVQHLVECWNGAMVANLGACPAKPAPVTTITCWNGTLVVDQSECTLPPPPPPPTPLPVYDPCGVGATSFVVYFPWDKSTLTDQARNVIANATDTAKLCNISDVTIEGHADSSGQASYNVGLSRRRANTVEGALRTNGLTTTSIVKSAKGETALALPTGDGVREPLNRRTEVIIRLIPGSYLVQ